MSTDQHKIEILAPPALSFDEFYAEHRPVVGRALGFALGGVDLGFEACDEAMSRAYQRWPEVSGYANPAGWVFRSGLNWGRSLLRRRKRWRARQRFLVSAEAVSDAGVDVDLFRALGHLSDDHRVVVVLRFYSDWTVSQIAAALDIAEGTVKSRLNRAIESMRSDLAAWEVE